MSVERLVMAQHKMKFFEIVECVKSIKILKEEQRNRGAWEPRQPAITVSSSSGTFGSQGRKKSRQPFQATQSQQNFKTPTISSGGSRSSF